MSFIANFIFKYHLFIIKVQNFEYFNFELFIFKSWIDGLGLDKLNECEINMVMNKI
jgi:hypothetical protein